MKFSLFFLLLILLNVYTESCDEGDRFSCYPKGCSVVANKTTCLKCTVDSQCYNYPKYVCNDEGLCEMRSLSNVVINIEWYEVLSFVVCFALNWFSVVGGIGGGIMLVSSLVAIGQFHIKATSPMSTAIIFGAALSSMMMTIPKKHPNGKSPVIDWDFISTVGPITLSGTLIGVLFNIIFPQWLTLLTLLLVSFISFFLVTRKAIKCFFKENRMKKKAREEKRNKQIEETLKEIKKEDEKEDEKEIEQKTKEEEKEEQEENEGGEEIELKEQENSSSSSSSKNTSDSSSDSESTTTSSQEEEEESENETKKQSTFDDLPEEGGEKKDEEKVHERSEKEEKVYRLFLLYDSLQVPIHKFLWILFAWIVVFLVALFRGSKRNPSIVDIESCDWLWWLILFVAFPILFFQSYIHAFWMFIRHRINLKLGFEYEETDMKWTLFRTITIPALFVLSGTFAAFIGTGGGLINGPIMIFLGLHPDVVMTTNLAMIFMTSSSSFTQYMIAKKLRGDYALMLMILGFFAAILGRMSASFIIQKTGRRSIIILSLSVLIVVSAISSLGVGIYKIVLAVQNNESMGFISPCA